MPVPGGGFGGVGSTLTSALDEDVFYIPPKAPPEALRRWRRATLALNAARRFRYTAKLDEIEAVAGSGKFKATGHVAIAAARFIAAGEIARKKREEKGDTSDVKLRSGGHFGFEAEDLVKLVNDHKPENLEALGFGEGVAKALRSDVDKGLPDDDDREKRTAVFGTNTYPKKPGHSFFYYLWEACQDRTLQILMGCAVISLIAGMIAHPSDGWYEGTGIGFAIFLCIIVTSISDYRQAIQFRSLTDENNNIQITVIRGGRRVKISIYELLVGDLLPLAIGDQVPGDGIVVEGHSLSIDESSMTGESMPVHKDAKHKPYLLSGCKVLDGSGTMLVTGVGVNTEWGKIMMTLQQDNNEETPLQVRLNGTATYIGYVGCTVAFIVLIVLLARYFAGAADPSFKESKAKTSRVINDVVQIFAVAVTIIVVSVPEGLPLAVTLTLAYSMKKMMVDRALVRHLAACETMGSSTAICSDKTGTLTLNQMTVVDSWVVGDTVVPAETSLIEKTKLLIFEAAAFNSTGSVFMPPNGGTPEVSASPTEQAILSWALNLGMHFEQETHSGEKLFVETFNSAKKRAGVAVKRNDGRIRVHWKGASEIVLGMCDKWMDKDGSTQPLTEEKRAELMANIQRMAEASLRTICFGYKDFPEYVEPAEGVAYELPTSGLTCLAIVGIKDPCRPGVQEAVARCQRAGVKVRMVTGDNPVTAKAIARECGILTEGGLVIEGKDFRVLSTEEMMKILPKIDVMARSSPTDKHTMVKTLRQMGEVVGVTGDGTNDAPALYEADIGLAMGIAGTEVAKQAADIVILDDNFASIVRVIRWGRSVFSNIQKFLQFQLTVNVVALTLNFLIAVSRGSGVPLTAVQLLWVNLIMDTLGALALATEPPQDSLLDKKPVGRRDPLINNVMWRNIMGQALYQVVLLMVLDFRGNDILGIPPEPKHVGNKRRKPTVVRTIIFNAFVFCQIFNEINARRPETFNVFDGFFSNRMFMAVITITIGLQIIIVELLGDFAQTVPLEPKWWALSVGLGLVGMPIAALVKLIPVPETPYFDLLKAGCLGCTGRNQTKAGVEEDGVGAGVAGEGASDKKTGNGKGGEVNGKTKEVVV